MHALIKWARIGGISLAASIVILLLVGVTFEWLAEQGDAKKFPPPGRLVEVGGKKLHIDCAGEGAPIIVVDAGAGNWSTQWKHVQKQLAKGGRVCLHDRVGFGWSDPSDERRTGARLAVQLHELLAAAGEKPPFIVVGHSLGGYIARFYYDAFPGEVAGIVLVDSANEIQFKRMPYITEKLAGAGKQMKTAAAMARVGLLRVLTLPKTSKDLPDPEAQAIVDAAAKTPGYWTALAQTLPAGIWIADELANEGGQLGDTPLLVISSGRSADTYCETLGVDCAQTQKDWDALQAQLPALSTNSAQITHPTATHEINIDDPAFVVERIAGLRDSLKN